MPLPPTYKFRSIPALIGLYTKFGSAPIKFQEDKRMFINSSVFVKLRLYPSGEVNLRLRPFVPDRPKKNKF